MATLTIPGFAERLERAPSWLFSTGLHLLVFVALAYFMVLQKPAEEEVVCEFIPRAEREVPEFLPERLPEIRDRSYVVEENSTSVVFLPNSAENAEEPLDEEFKSTVGEIENAPANSPFRGEQRNGVIGVGGPKGGDRKGFGGRIPGGGIPGIREQSDAVLRGLLWLARHQNEDGSWGVKTHRAKCGAAGKSGDCASDSLKTADEQYDSGVTGLALLAFLGAGYTHLSRDVEEGVAFGPVVRRALQYLKSAQSSEGRVGPASDRHMYNQALAALALSEAYGMTGSRLVQEEAQRSIGYLIQAQNPGRGWRYTSRCGDSDTSVTGWVVMALKSAEMAGLAFPKTVYDGALGFLDDVTEASYGRTGYYSAASGKVYCEHNLEFDHHESLSAIAALCRVFTQKNREDRNVRMACDLLVRDLPEWKGYKTDFYYWYYGSLALFQYDGPKGTLWMKWNEALTVALLKNQNRTPAACREGSWDPVDRWSCEAGRVYSTAINVLTLEVYYRYPNVFGRK